MTITEPRQVLRDDLLRSLPFTVTRADEGGQPGDGLTFEGYAAVWDQETLIDSWEGTFYESIARGAFRKSIRERTPRLQFDHGYHPLIGSIPIGRISDLAEDDQGLAVTARLSDNWLVEPVRDAISDGSIDGMSFRFSVVREEWRDVDGKLIKDDEELLSLLWRPDDRGPLRRTLKEVKVPELGPVVWPAYEGTSAAVRSERVTIDLGRLREPGQRAELARAVFLADAAERGDDDPAGLPSAPSIATTCAGALSRTSESSGTQTSDAPPANGGHPSEEAAPVTGTPPATDTKSAGEHESAPPTDSRALLRQGARELREYVNSIKKGAS